jgi:hypothetical protein
VDLRIKTAIISLFNINGRVFITETECVYCAVRTGSLYINEANLCLYRIKHRDIFTFILVVFNTTSLVATHGSGLIRN